MTLPTSVYIIYSADVISEDSSDIDGMSPAKHLSHINGGEIIAAKFTETEGDDQYDYGYLGNESDDPRYFPYGYADSEGLTEAEDPIDCPDCEGSGIRSAIGEGYCGTCEASGTLPPFGEGIARGLGQHRKWVGEITLDEWRSFARAYCIDLDDDEILPTRFENTLGSITEYGCINAICIDNREGWECGYGPVIGVLESQMYVSFASEVIS